MNPAFVWWNEELGNPPNKIISAVCPYPKTVTHIWEKFFPFFIYYIDIWKPINPIEYWESIRTLIKDYFQEMFVPDPVKNFDLFVQLLYNVNIRFHPTNVQDALDLFESINPTKRKNFLLFELPLVLNDYSLYINIIYESYAHNNNIWKDITSELSTILAIFGNVYILKNIQTVEDSTWSTIVRLLTIFKELIKCIPYKSREYQTNMNDLLNGITSIVPYAPDTALTTISRIFFNICRDSNHRIENLKVFINSFLENLPLGSFAFVYSLKYCISNHPKTIKNFHSNILKIIHKTPINSPEHFDLYTMMMKYGPKDQILTMIYQKSLQNPVYYRLGLDIILNNLAEYSNNASVTQWGILFIRRICIFILLAANTRKYLGRLPFICNFLSQALKFDLDPKVSRQLRISLATISMNEDCPFIVPQVIDRSDELTLKEYKLMKSHEILSKELKFFPFSSKRSKFANITFKKSKEPKVNKQKSLKLKQKTSSNSQKSEIQKGSDKIHPRKTITIDDEYQTPIFGKIPIRKNAKKGDNDSLRILKLQPLQSKSVAPQTKKHKIKTLKNDLKNTSQKQQPKSLLYGSISKGRIDLSEKPNTSKSFSNFKKNKIGNKKAKRTEKKSEVQFLPQPPDSLSYTPAINPRRRQVIRDPTATFETNDIIFAELPNLASKPTNFVW
ncbi:hypothetical protein TVAG_069240 [Trichomonas vaginalis G3]|uniref:Uncharacterized protein n=1 Tax=Trichomonas vaginalis (strain ATCC PRA-98 / G3) TaxID=412133 RepID=A2EL79_TRIV3|nr:hypothetical protein TVAGG3_0004630 [Trichomonas vaginalis G3]EAY06556.1 hypothetical protein TVAG_069240 [Trichomonas vaginalis G3]KAI5538828.1 hypothetical protein TVAGG3_0004630 [Trichomonas vaginalis G3]|eukprot:XP_001318779.1 hypothetical protein [Trichomonas vaginalis G3]